MTSVAGVEGAAFRDLQRLTEDASARLVAPLQLLRVSAKFTEGGVVLVADDHGSFRAAVDQNRRLASEPGARDHLAEDVARLSDLVPVHGRLVTHSQIVADSRHGHPSLLSYNAFLSYDSYIDGALAMPP